MSNKFRLGAKKYFAGEIMACSKDQKKIEEDAVNAVKMAFRGVNRVSVEISANDKTPCVDGILRLYSNESMSIDNLIGDIDVQVKGTVAKRKKLYPKRSIRICDLKYYKNHCGALYFVVYEKETCDEVYFKQLLPFDINRILKDDSDKKSVSVQLEPFPTDPAEVMGLVSQAILDKHLQTPVSSLAYTSLQDYYEAGYVITGQGLAIDLIPEQDSNSLMPYRNGAYVYGLDEHGTYFPVDKIEEPLMVLIKRVETITSGDISFEAPIFTGVDKSNGRFIRIDGFEFNLENKSMSLVEKESLSIRLRDLRLLREMCRTGVLMTGDDIFIQEFPGTEDRPFSLDQEITFLERIDEVLKCLKIKLDLNLSSLSEQNFCDFDILYSCLVKGDVLYRPNFSKGPHLIEMPGFCIQVLYVEVDVDKYLLFDALDIDPNERKFYATGADGSVLGVVPPLLGLPMILPFEKMLEIGNIDADVFKKSCDFFPINKLTVDYAINSLILMFNAVDANALCAFELLECCDILIDYLKPFCEDGFADINKLQIKARITGLDSSDNDLLTQIIAGNYSLKVKASAAALRMDRAQVNAYLSQMDATERSAFYHQPIFHLFNS